MVTTNVILKALTALLLALPVGGYAVGSLAASSTGDDTPRQTIQLEEAGPASGVPATRRHHQRPVRGDDAGSTRSEPTEVESADPEAAVGEDPDADDAAEAAGSDAVETIVPRYDESPESEDPDPDDEPTATAADGDDQPEDQAGDPTGDEDGDQDGDETDETADDDDGRRGLSGHDDQRSSQRVDESGQDGDGR